jgi:hypothetical protein
MLQNPEAKKKEKYQLRPPFGADWSGAAIPDLAGETCMAGIGFELTVTPIIAKPGVGNLKCYWQLGLRVRIRLSSLADGWRLRSKVTCHHGNESH